jgi:hypothetical protein
VNTSQILTGEQVRAVLDARHDGWKRDREGWVKLELSGVMWRVHYRRGELIEVAWWEAFEHAQCAHHRAQQRR